MPRKNNNPTGIGGPKPGDPSRNPSGLTKEQASIRTAIRNGWYQMAKEAQEHFLDCIRAGTKDGFWAAKEVLERVDPKDTIEVGGDGAGVLVRVQVSIQGDVKKGD